MADQVRILDTKALGEMADLLRQLGARIERILEEAENEIDRSLREVELAKEQAADEVRFAERQLESLEDEARGADSAETDDGFDAARRVCEGQIEAAAGQLHRIERSQEELRAAIDRFRGLALGGTNDILRKGVHFLNEKTKQLESYSKLRIGEAHGSVPLSRPGIASTSTDSASATGTARSLLLPRNVFELSLAAKDADLFLKASEEATKHLKNRAHPIEKHVGKSDLFHAIRLALEGPLDRERPTPSSSSFSTVAEQASAVSKALTDPKNAGLIQAWADGGWKTEPRRALTTKFLGGAVLHRGMNELREGTDARVVLKHLDSGEIAVLTAFPEADKT